MNADDIFGFDPSVLGDLGAMFNAKACAGCHREVPDLRSWPPGSGGFRKYCGLCSLKKAIEFAEKRGTR
jgi:hypothetical protein